MSDESTEPICSKKQALEILKTTEYAAHLHRQYDDAPIIKFEEEKPSNTHVYINGRLTRRELQALVFLMEEAEKDNREK